MKEELERQLTEALILENPFDLPESLLEGSENSELAAFQMKKMILLNRIAEMEGIEVKEEEIEAESNGSKLTDGVRRDLRMNLRRRKTIDFLLREAEVSEPEKGIWKRWFQKEK